MSLDDHLGSNEDVCPVLGKSFQDFLITALGPCGVIIHAKDSRLWKFFFHHLLDLLGSCFESSYIRGGTDRTSVRLSCLIAAVMADQLSSIMLT